LSQRRLDYSVDHSVVVDTILARVLETMFKVLRNPASVAASLQTAGTSCHFR
jgi:hypothetical protein